MLAYEFMKNNPKQNATLVSDKWLELFTDPDVPYGVKEELRQIQSITTDFSDAVLYFHGILVMDFFISGRERVSTTRLHSVLEENKRWIEALYTFHQLEPQYDNALKRMFFELCDKGCPRELDYTRKDMLKACELYCEHYGIPEWTIWTAYFFGLRQPPYNMYGCHSHHTNNTDTWLRQQFQYMSINFLRSSSVDTINKASELFSDVPSPIDGQKYTSIGDLEDAHDQRTAETVQKMLMEKPDTLEYYPAFLEAVKKYGFTLPMSRNDLIERGAIHHNCVATYANKHCSNNRYPMCRLVFDKNATAELSIHVEHGLVVAVMVAQYKGRYNKDIPYGENLTRLRIALTGLSVHLLDVNVKRHG
jgi:hypothetical protein